MTGSTLPCISFKAAFLSLLFLVANTGITNEVPTSLSNISSPYASPVTDDYVGVDNLVKCDYSLLIENLI